MAKTRNFNPQSDVKLLCTCGDHRCDKRSVTQEFLNRLQVLRNEVNRPLKVTSGGRCPYHPNELKRDKPADHQKCQAVDIAVNNGVERGQLVKYAIDCGFNAIGVAKGFVHLGVRGELKAGTVIVWTY